MTDFPCVNSILIEKHLKEQEDYEHNLEQKVLEETVYECGSCNTLYHLEVDADICCDRVGETEIHEEGYVCGECASAYVDFDKAKWCCS